MNGSSDSSVDVGVSCSNFDELAGFDLAGGAANLTAEEPGGGGNKIPEEPEPDLLFGLEADDFFYKEEEKKEKGE